MELSGHQSVNDLVENDFRFARALDSYGINFYQYADRSLSEVCKAKEVSLRQLLKRFEAITADKFPDFTTLYSYPVDHIIDYLQHHHFLFIKDQLPFVRRMVESINQNHHWHKDLVEDLKFVFPIFYEDFIHHIYEEEDTLFAYIMQLYQMSKSGVLNGDLYMAMESYSIQQLAMEHVEDDDEMKGIRGILQQYDVEALQDSRLKVVFKELTKFDRELELHARVENEILFPKALNLEKRVKEILAHKIKFN